MLEPRMPWRCTTEGGCVFMGGTAEFDIYMANCNQKPYDPNVVLVPMNGDMYTEFNSVGHFEREMADPESQLLHQHRDKVSELGAALTFVQCFFPTPVRTAMDKIARGEEL